jgi:TonB family protein
LQHSRISLAPSADAQAELEIERMLEQVLEQVRLATCATAAAVALQTGNEMVCRAAAGPNAPDVGVRLDMSSGLSGACVRTREMQYCEDTERDPRVNAEASRRLEVRSVLVVPLLEDDRLLGVLEILSPHAAAFGRRDLENLEILGQAIVKNLRAMRGAAPPAPKAADDSSANRQVAASSVKAAVPVPTPEAEKTQAAAAETPRFAWPTAKPKSNHDTVAAAESEAAAEPALPVEAGNWVVAASSNQSRPAQRAREWGTDFFMVAVIAAAVILGWTVGRPRWQRSYGADRKAGASSGQVSTLSDPADNRSTTPAGKTADSDAVEASDVALKPGNMPLTKPSRSEAAGGLVVYQDGKVIFRQDSRPGPVGKASVNFQTASPQPAEKVATIFLSPEMASARLLQRIEPIYPESALELHIQGEVELDAIVGKDGSVQQLTLVSGDSLLAAAAADAVRQWRFRPYVSEGHAVDFTTRVTVVFRLP